MVDRSVSLSAQFPWKNLLLPTPMPRVDGGGSMVKFRAGGNITQIVGSDYPSLPATNAREEAVEPEGASLLPGAIRSGAIQIDQDVARFGAFARANDSAVLEFIHDSGGAAVSEPETPLEKGNAGFLFAPNHFDALLNNFLVLITAGFTIQRAGWLGKLLVDVHLIARFALFGDPIDDALNFVVGDQRALGADQFG